MHDPEATIVAIATPPGRGGVGCVRLSGPDAHAIAAALFRAAGGSSRPLQFGLFLDAEGRKVDHGYRVLFPEGGSYTGEASAELWPHGSPAVLEALVAAATVAGAQPAAPGEFTYRALRRGRLDLARAEAVRDLIASRTAYQARVALSQAEGSLSRHLQPLRAVLTEWIARGEAAVEFVDESETHLARGELQRGVRALAADCDGLLRDFRSGRIVREGARVAVTGRPNAGKSSLFNRLLARERAIVTDVPGTTRDTLEETLDLDGVPLTLIDTAGLRQTDDPVEGEGVRRAHHARETADLELLVIDGARPEPHAEERRALGETGRRTIVVLSKLDLPGVAARPLPAADAIAVSAVDDRGIDELRAELRRRLLGDEPLEHPRLTNARHARALTGCRDALARAADGLDAGLSEELALEELRLAIEELGSITGEFGNEELYDRIFSTFCIGK